MQFPEMLGRLQISGEVELLNNNAGLLVGSFSSSDGCGTGSDGTIGGVSENCDKNGAIC